MAHPEWSQSPDMMPMLRRFLALALTRGEVECRVTPDGLLPVTHGAQVNEAGQMLVARRHACSVRCTTALARSCSSVWVMGTQPPPFMHVSA